MKKKLKIYFVDFWSNFNLNDNFFTQHLNSVYDIEITPENPDVLFYSVFGINHRFYNCKRVFFTGENIRPDFRRCDFSLSFDYDEYGGRNFRLPLYALFDDVNKLTKEKNIKDIISKKTKFCNFIYSNPNCKIRNQFFRALSKYKKVDSAGRLYNNIGRAVEDKLQFISEYKFTIAFENESEKGYTTEKIFEPMLVNSIPIYCGNPDSGKEFNPKSFINYHDFSSMEEVINRIIEIDNDDNLYIEMLSQPWFEGNKVNDFVDDEKIKERLMQIVEAKIKPVSSKSKVFSPNTLIRILAKISIKINYRISRLIYKIKIFRPYKIKTKLLRIIGK